MMVVMLMIMVMLVRRCGRMMHMMTVMLGRR